MEQEQGEEGPSFKIDDIVVTLLELVHHHAAWDTDAGGLRMRGERGVKFYRYRWAPSAWFFESVGSVGLFWSRMATCGLLSGKEVPIRCRPSDVCLFEASLEGI